MNKETKIGALVLDKFRKLTKRADEGKATSRELQELYVLNEILKTYWADWVAEGVLDDDMPDQFEAWVEKITDENRKEVTLDDF